MIIRPGSLADQQLVIDGILGIGGRPGLTGPVAELAESLERAGVPVVAVDLPSGVAADSGAVPGPAIRATHTVTFGEAKPCHLLEPALSRCGEITVVDIGLVPDPAIPAGPDRDGRGSAGSATGPIPMSAATSTPAGWSASTPDRTSTRARR